MNRLRNKLRKSVWLAGFVSIVAVQPVWANGEAIEGSKSQQGNEVQEQPITHVPQINEIERSATTINEWLTQMAQAPVVQVTDVQLNPVDTGFEVVLITSDGQLPIPAPSIVGNALIADIPSAVLALPDGDEFLATEPAAGIALISITNLPENRVRVAITGTEAPPTAEIRTAAQGLILSIAPGVAGAEGSEDDSIQVHLRKVCEVTSEAIKAGFKRFRFRLNSEMAI